MVGSGYGDGRYINSTDEVVYDQLRDSMLQAAIHPSHPSYQEQGGNHCSHSASLLHPSHQLASLDPSLRLHLVPATSTAHVLPPTAGL